MFIQIESRKAGLSRIRDVGAAGSNPVIPTNLFIEVFTSPTLMGSTFLLNAR
jgi:hypothetical protein